MLSPCEKTWLVFVLETWRAQLARFEDTKEGGRFMADLNALRARLRATKE